MRLKEPSEITSKDLKWLWTHLDNEEQVNTVVEYLEKGNKTIRIVPTYDGQAGWHGEHVYLDNVDLSGNGFCFNGKNLYNHCKVYEEYTQVRESDEYKQYLELDKKYSKIKKYFSR